MPSKADLTIYQGDDWAAKVTVRNADGTPADITGHTAQAQIREDVADNTAVVLAEISATVASPDVFLALGHAETLTIEGGKYVWDLQIVSAAGIITTILAGKATVTPEVTRE